MSTQIEVNENKKVLIDLDGFDRIRASSPAHVNDRIDRQIENSVRQHGSLSKDVLSVRINALDHEWDIDRAAMAFFATVGSLALLLGVTRGRKWLGLMALQLPFLAYHASEGWCPPVGLLRRLGFRSRSEIDAEKYALKTLRGDFRQST